MASLYRLALEQYDAMVQSGLISERDRIHLINGFLVEKMPRLDPHATADELCGRALDAVIPPGWHVRSAKPVRLPPDSVVDRKVEVYSDPASDGYRSRSDYAAGDNVPVVIDGVEIAKIAVDYLMP
jgi:hypothetical protein